MMRAAAASHRPPAAPMPALLPTALAALFPALLFMALATWVPAEAATSRVSGRVIDSDTQKPIVDAEIELANTNGGQGYHRARSKKAGGVVMGGSSSGRYYALTVGAGGYADFVIGGWQIPAAERAAELVIPLDRAGVLVVNAQR